MSGFKSAQTGDFDKYFMTTTDLIDRYAQGGLWMWGGNNATGITAWGTLGDNTSTNRSSPVQTISKNNNWKQIACGFNHTAAIKTDGSLWLWGVNGTVIGGTGQLGDGTIVNKSSPVQTIAGGTNWKQVACGQLYTAAIKTDGTLWCWGTGNNGQLGDSNNTSLRSSPVQTIAGGTNWKQVACGGFHTAAIKTDGTLWTWGVGNVGQLGDSTTISGRSSPVQTIAAGTNWKQVSCGQYHTVAIKTDGSLWSFGFGGFGQLGDSNSTTVRSSPVQTIAAGTNWKQVACGQNHTAAIKTDGSLWLWGSGLNGQLGDSTTITGRSSPVQTIAGGNNWKQVACNSAATAFNAPTAAIKTDGSLWTWGDNLVGELGDSTLSHRSSPIQTIAGGTNWKQVAVGGSFIGAVQNSDIGIIS